MFTTEHTKDGIRIVVRSTRDGNEAPGIATIYLTDPNGVEVEAQNVEVKNAALFRARLNRFGYTNRRVMHHDDRDCGLYQCECEDCAEDMRLEHEAECLAENAWMTYAERSTPDSERDLAEIDADPTLRSYGDD